MKYEKAKVKEYNRKNSKGEKVPYKQINLGQLSTFPKETNVAIISLDELKELEAKAKPTVIEKLEAEIVTVNDEKKKLQQEILQLKQENKILTNVKDELDVTVDGLKVDLEAEKKKYEKLIFETNSKIDGVNAIVIEASEKLEAKNVEIAELLKEHKRELEVKNAELLSEKDNVKKIQQEHKIEIDKLQATVTALSVGVSELLSRSLFNRIRNTTPAIVEEIIADIPKVTSDVKEVVADVTNKE